MGGTHRIPEDITSSDPEKKKKKDRLRNLKLGRMESFPKATVRCMNLEIVDTHSPAAY